MTSYARRVVAAMTGICLPLLTINMAQACLPSELESKLSQIRSNFGAIKVVSTHRPGATIAGTGKPSYHRWCRAVDFVPPPGKYAAVVAWLHSNHSGGVGTYSSGHIHIDNGPHVRFSRGWSGGGSTQTASSKRGRASKSTYASNSDSKPSGRSGKGSSGRAQVADKSWALKIVQSN